MEFVPVERVKLGLAEPIYSVEPCRSLAAGCIRTSLGLSVCSGIQLLIDT